MMLLEPSPTPADLRFSLAGIPVRVHPFFWLMAIFIAGLDRDPRAVLIVVVAIFVSVLVHELGHALTAMAFGNRAKIVLWMMGGLAIYEPGTDEWRKRVLIAAAGPLAGFLFAILLAVGLLATGHTLIWIGSGPGAIVPLVNGISTDGLNVLVNALFFVNIMWGLLNLLPVLPLDGGQITRIVLQQVQPAGGLRTAYWVSLITAGGVALLSLTGGRNNLFLTIMFGLLAYQSYQAIQALSGYDGFYDSYSNRRPW